MGKRHLKRSYDGALDWDMMRQMLGLRLNICLDYHWILFCSDYDCTFVWTTIGHCSDYEGMLFCSDYDWTFVWTTIEHCSDYDWTFVRTTIEHLFGLYDETFVWTIRLTTLYSLLD